jgi:outer membrane protein
MPIHQSHSLKLASLTLATLFTPTAAHAEGAEGSWQAKAFISGVLPHASIIEASGPAASALNGANATASDNWVPTIAIEYFIGDSVSLETICCATAHHMSGTGALAGVPLVENAVIMPFTLTAKYHFELGQIRPYLGAGPALIVFANRQTSAALQTMGLENVSIPAQFGLALQAGIDVPLNQQGLSFSADVKRYFVRPTANFSDTAGTVLLSTRHRLDPVVVSAGLGLRF